MIFFRIVQITGHIEGVFGTQVLSVTFLFSRCQKKQHMINKLQFILRVFSNLRAYCLIKACNLTRDWWLGGRRQGISRLKPSLMESVTANTVLFYNRVAVESPLTKSPQLLLSSQLSPSKEATLQCTKTSPKASQQQILVKAKGK